jgi:hypothetical protein
MQLFKEELHGVPAPIQKALLLRIEEIVRLINGRYNQAQHDYRVNNFTKEEIAAMFHAVFDLATKFRVARISED